MTVPDPRASFFTDSRGPGDLFRKCLRHPLDDASTPVKNSGGTLEKIDCLANPNVVAATFGLAKLFFQGGPPEFFTGAGASSRGCRGSPDPGNP